MDRISTLAKALKYDTHARGAEKGSKKKSNEECQARDGMTQDFRSYSSVTYTV